MYIKNLPNKKVEELERAFQKAKNGREKIRYQALWLLTQKYKRKEAAKIIGRSEKTIREWITIYNKKGISGLKNKGQPGNYRKLSNKQKDEVKKLIRNKKPDELGYKGKFWNIPNLKRLVRDQFKVKYKAKDSYRRLLHYCGFTFHKPNKVNKKQDPHMRKRFEDNLKKSSNGTREKIVWYW